MKYRSALKIGLAILLAAFVTGAVFIVLRIQRHRSAERILYKMAAVYKNCETYQDSGTVEMTPPYIDKLNFTTAFIRPGRFRYEHITQDGRDNHYLVWRRGTQIAAWSSLEPEIVKNSESFNMTIAYATGSSMTAAHTIPALLFSKDEISGWRLTDMVNAAQIGDAITEDVECFRIKGRVAAFNTIVWIDKSTFLVRKIERMSDRGTRIIINYNPIINVEIPDAALEYNLALSQR